MKRPTDPTRIATYYLPDDVLLQFAYYALFDYFSVTASRKGKTVCVGRGIRDLKNMYFKPSHDTKARQLNLSPAQYQSILDFINSLQALQQ